jgi:predicted Rdx family selenoprotein
VAAAIKADLQLEAEIIEGSRGEFTVWVGDTCVAKKDERGFPDERETVAAVRDALQR